MNNNHQKKWRVPYQTWNGVSNEVKSIYYSSNDEPRKIIDEQEIACLNNGFDVEKYWDIEEGKHLLKIAREILTKRELLILMMSINGNTLEESGELQFVTRERVRQILKKSLRKITVELVKRIDAAIEKGNCAWVKSEYGGAYMLSEVNSLGVKKKMLGVK